jgi:hypothetical protein
MIYESEKIFWSAEKPPVCEVKHFENRRFSLHEYGEYVELTKMSHN